MDRFVNPPIWHDPLTPGGRIIIAIDRQKPWERVTAFSKRVIDFMESITTLHSKGYRLKTRIIIGGLRDPIQDIVLEKGIDITLNTAIFTAELLEMAFFASVGAKDPYETPLARRMKKMYRYGPSCNTTFCIDQDRVQIFGVPSARVDKLYNTKRDLELKVLYR